MHLVRVASPRDMQREIERRRATDRMMCAPFFGSGVAAGAKWNGVVGGVPTVTSISPDFGFTGGGQAVTIRGTNFSVPGSATGAKCNGVSITSFTVVNDTTITGVTGASSTANGSVTVTGPGGTGTLAGGYPNGAFSYLPAFDVLSVGDIGATVSQWNDQTANANHWAQATGAKQPSIISSALNGKATLRFNGTTAWVKTPNFTRAQSCMTWIVVKQITWVLNAYVMSDPVNPGVLIAQNPATPSLIQYSNAFGNATTGLAVGSFGVIRALWNGTSSSLTLNNGTPVTGSNPGSAGVTLGMVIGAANYGGDSSWSNVEVAMAGCCATPSAGDITIVETWLRSRYLLY